MKTTQIRERMSNMKPHLVKAILHTIAENLYEYPDLEVAIGNKEILDEMSESVVEKLPYTRTDIADNETIRLYQQIQEYNDEKRIPSKNKCIDIIEEIFENDMLFEIIALLYLSDDINEFMQEMGCAERYDELSKEKIFQTRKQYVLLLYQYYLAAANLYGVIHISELAEIIEQYEKKNWKKVQVQRETGAYAKTILLSPQYFSETFLGLIAECSFRNVPMTIDGLLLHESFASQFQEEMEELQDFLKAYKDEEKEDALEKFFEQETLPEFRELYEITLDKPQYITDREHFLRYADEDYQEDILSARNLKIFLKKNYLNAIQKALDEWNGFTVEELINVLISQIRETVSSNFAGKCLDMDTEFVQDVFEILKDFGIDISDIDEANEILQYIMNMRNEERMWANGGYSPMELCQMYPRGGQTKIVPGSSHAANMLEQSRIELEKMGLVLDTESNATTIPTMNFTNGLNSNEIVTGTRKIYPNDPCPCGSGKKFKKCCGKEINR